MGPLLRRAAQYLRVSTDQQRYSLTGQAAEIAAYAEQHGYEVVRTYIDCGVSGVSTAGRKGLQQLLGDVVSGEPGFETILIYDISRWGRFQNPDESAHYEFVCRQEGVTIEYCAECFGEPGIASALLKQVKRVMAAEYSRQLSETVASAQRRYAAHAFWQGGPPGFGLRRAVIDERGQMVAILEPGERKSLQTHKVVLVPGPPSELAVIARIYRLFLEGGTTRTAIVRLLNQEAVPYGDGRPWTYQRVQNVLTNPIYSGRQVFGKTLQRLGQPRSRRPSSEWVIAPSATESIPAETQARAATLIANRMVMLGDADMLSRLKALARRRGRLSSALIKAAPGLPCPATYANRFGSLRTAYELIGYDFEAERAKRRPRELAKSARTRRLNRKRDKVRPRADRPR